jgi:hypothetical protein
MSEEFDQHKNLAVGIITDVPDIFVSPSPFPLQEGEAELFAPNMPVTLVPEGETATAENSEIGYVTQIVGNTIHVERAQEGSQVKAVQPGWSIIGSVTAKSLTDIEEAVTATKEAVEALTIIKNINVKDFGALGNGVADDTAAIQAAIDAVDAAGGGEVHIPRGSYVITSRINLKKRVSIIGAGMSNDGVTPLSNTSGTLIRQTTNAADAFYLEANGFDTGYIRIENLSIEGKGVGVSTGNGINLKRVTSNPILHIYITSVTVRGFGGYGIQGEALINSVIEKNLVSFCGGGINVCGQAGFPATSTTVRNNYLNWNTGIGIRFNYTDYSAILNNASDHQDIHYQVGDCTNVTVAGNGAEWNNTDTPTNGIGFDIWGSRYTSLDNNFVLYNKNTALRVRSSATYATTNLLVRNFRNAIPDASTTGMSVASGCFVGIEGLDNGAGGIGTITGSGVVYNISALHSNLQINAANDTLESYKHLNPVYDLSFTLGSGSKRWNAIYAGALTLYYGNGITFADGSNIVAGSGTGTKIGTATNQKIGFFNATPVTQRTGNIITALAQLGLVLTGTIAIADISATGTPSATTFLRGDGVWATPAGGGGGTPSGSNTQLQFNDSGAFGGDAGLTYNKTTDTLNVAGGVGGGSGGSLVLAGGTTLGAGAGIELFNYNTGVLRAGTGYAFQWSGSRFAGGYNLGMDLGDSSIYFNNSYAQRRYFNSTAYIDGATAGQMKATGLFMPVQAPTSSAPAYVKGAMYFDTTLNKLRIGGATGWETVTSS